MTCAVGTVLAGRYRILRLLGQGGYGAVYLAEDMRLGNKKVAVKESFDRTKEAQEQFQLEANLLATLDHESLPRVTDHFVETSGSPFLVMDYIEGEDLETTVLQSQQPLDEAKAVGIMIQICKAVGYLHNHKPSPVIHRDIKPGNIKLTPDGRAVLVDFGIAKVYKPGKGTARVAKAVSPPFSPPEQYTGHTDARSDVYALGATLYSLLARDELADAMERTTQPGAVPSVRRTNARVSNALDQVITCAIALDPNKRYASAGEMAAALEKITRTSSNPQSQASAQYQSGGGTATPQGAGNRPICPRCGKPNRVGARFCSRDGTALTSSVAGQAQPGARQQPPAQPQSFPQSQSSHPSMPTLRPAPGLSLDDRFEVANAFANRKDYPHAIVEYMACLQQGMRDPAVYNNLAVCFRQNGQVNEGLAIINQGLSLHPADPGLQLQLALLFYEKKDIQNALNIAGSLWQTQPTNEEAANVYGDLLMEVDRYGEAVAVFEQQTRLKTSSSTAHTKLGKAYLLNNQSEKALKILKKAVRLDNKNATAKFYLGLAFHLQKKYLDALRFFREASADNPGMGAAYYYIGEALIKLERYTSAVPELNKAVQLLPGDPDPHVALAVCYILTNRKTDAKNEVQQALRLNPKHQVALDLRDKLK